LPVQRDQRVPTQQLGLGQANQQLTGPKASSTLLDRPDATVEPTDHIELVDELSDSGNPGDGGQRWVRRADARFRGCFRRRTLFTDKVLLLPGFSTSRQPRFSLQGRHLRRLTHRSPRHYLRIRV